MSKKYTNMDINILEDKLACLILKELYENPSSLKPLARKVQEPFWRVREYLQFMELKKLIRSSEGRIKLYRVSPTGFYYFLDKELNIALHQKEIKMILLYGKPPFLRDKLFLVGPRVEEGFYIPREPGKAQKWRKTKI